MSDTRDSESGVGGGVWTAEDSGEAPGPAGKPRSCTAGKGVQPAGPPVLDSERGPAQEREPGRVLSPWGTE